METQYDVVEGVDLKTLKPMPHHILVRWIGKKETKGGVIIPENRERSGLMKGEILLVGPQCDERLVAGKEIKFDGLCEKEFLGAQVPGDRDPVFFMREEDVTGIIADSALIPLNGKILIKPDLKPEEMSGLVVVEREEKGKEIKSGKVFALDSQAGQDFKVGDRVWYNAFGAEEMKLGDFDGEMVHVVAEKHLVMVEE